MSHPKNISIQDYTYLLPEERIARYPLEERDASRLLVYQEGNIRENRYRRLADEIPESALLFFNNTRVIEARLLFQKPSGGGIEIFCLEPHEQYPDITSAMHQKGKVWWHCLVGGASKWKPGQILEKKIDPAHEGTRLQAKFIEKRPGSFLIELSWTDPFLSFAEILHRAGAIPLPPYIKRAAQETDKDRYQTIYAHYDGSVAAPTAGLHFTERIFSDLKSKNIQPCFVTLHVGAGTFQPVKSDSMEEHDMHEEWIAVDPSAIQNILSHPEMLMIAVGTTSLRTLETLYWIGVKIIDRAPETSPDDLLYLDQWEAYDLAEKKVPVQAALEALLNWMQEKKLEKLVAKTRLLIAPGYRFRIINGLITNFHQPQSTLLLLVAALIGENWKKVYEYALEKGFRFLSYGDGCLLWKENSDEDIFS